MDVVEDIETHSQEECLVPCRKKDSIGEAFLTNNVDMLRGKFLCIGHPLPKWMVRKRLPLPKPLPTRGHLPPGVSGWEPHSWRMEIAHREKKLREADAERHYYIPQKLRFKTAVASRGLLPILGPKDIRRHRVPLVKSLPLDLEDDGLPMTASIIEGFIHYNDQMCIIAPKGSAFYDEPAIAEKPDLLLRLAAGLSEVEAAGQQDPPRRAEQIDKLLEMAVELRQMGETLFWIVEKMLLIATDVAAAHPLDGYRREALARFVYGHFLDEIEQLAPAVDELERARCLSLSKDWSVDLQMEKKYPLLVQEVVDLQARVLLRMAQLQRLKHPKRAVRLCSRALRRLGDPQLVLTEAAVLLELGLAYKDDHNYSMARTALTMYLENFGSIVEPKGLCTALLECSRCYSMLGDTHSAQEFLLKVLELAKHSGLKDLTALALKSMGEGFLTIRYFRTASECLAKSFELYLELGMNDHMDVLRVLSAISKGLEILPYMSVLMNNIFEDDSDESMGQLLDWRLHRKPFWRQDTEFSPLLPRKHLYTTIELPEEEMDEEEKMNLEQAKALREEAITHMREDEALKYCARRLVRAERMKTGAFADVYHPDYRASLDLSLDSATVKRNESGESMTTMVKLKKLRLPDNELQMSLSRITEDVLEDILRRSLDKEKERTQASFSARDSQRISSATLLQRLSTPLLTTTHDDISGKVTIQRAQGPSRQTRESLHDTPTLKHRAPLKKLRPIKKISKKSGPLSKKSESQPKKPGSPSNKLGLPSSKPESPSSKPGSPSNKLGLPTSKPESPSSKPGSPSNKLGLPSSKPGSPSSKPGSPSSKPGSPSNKLGLPSSKPGSPSSKPGSPSSRLGSPSSKLGLPSSKPGSLSSKPGSLSSKPGSPSSKPGSPSSKPGSPSSKLGSPSSKPGSPPSKPGSPPNEPGSPSNKLGSPPSKPGSPSSKLGSPSSKPRSPPSKPGLPPSKPGSPPSKLGSPPSKPGSPSELGSPSNTPGSPPKKKESLTNVEASSPKNDASPRPESQSV